MPHPDNGRDAGPDTPDTTPTADDHATRLLAEAAELAATRAKFNYTLDDAYARLGLDADQDRRQARTDTADQVTDTLRQLQATLENPDTTPAAADRATRLLADAIGCQPDDTPGDPNP